MNESLITNFVKAYAPGKELGKSDETLLEFAKQMLPPEIVAPGNLIPAFGATIRRSTFT